MVVVGVVVGGWVLLLCVLFLFDFSRTLIFSLVSSFLSLQWLQGAPSFLCLLSQEQCFSDAASGPSLSHTFPIASAMNS